MQQRQRGLRASPAVGSTLVSMKQTAGQALTEEAFQYLAWMSRAVETYARAYKFSTGDRLSASGLTLIETLLEATWTPDRAAFP